MANNTQTNSNNTHFPTKFSSNSLSSPNFYAVEASFFSRRWRNLWKCLTTYKLHSSGMNFNRASKLLRLLTSPKIRVFDYSFCGNSKNFKWKSAENFYRLLFRRNVEVLKLRSISNVSLKRLFAILELDGKLSWRLELDEENNLPVNELFCPNLEDLSLLLELSDTVFRGLDLIAENLNSLNIEAVVWFPGLIYIDAPKLTRLKIRDPCYYTFQTIPTSLVEASIKLKCIDNTDWFLLMIIFVLSEFVRGMSSVKCSVLWQYAWFFRPQYYDDMAVFPDLTFFKTRIANLGDWEDLLCSLHCFPNLEHLELKLDEFYIVRPDSWVAPIVLPEFVRVYLVHANVSGRLRIYGPSGSGSLMEYNTEKPELLWTEYNFLPGLFKLPRSSLTCEIVFF
ncbi:hypothetical protein RDABS01_026822, partial [Bienertia sinuspersici]